MRAASPHWAAAARPLLARARRRCTPLHNTRLQDVQRRRRLSPSVTAARRASSEAAAQCGESEADSSELFDALWRAGGCKPDPPPVVLAHTALGRGLVARRGAPLEAGSLIVSLPLSHVLAVTDGVTADGASDARLARALLHAVDTHPLWRRYAALLPARTGAAALWPGELIDELQLRCAVDAAHVARADMQAHAARLQASSRAEALWALSMVRSRSFAVELADLGRCRVMVPLADLVNNEQATAVAVAEEDEEAAAWRVSADGRFELRAPRHFAQGEEVMIFYGHESSAELLISYGFAPIGNPADYVPLYADLSELLDDDRWTPREPARVARVRAGMLHAADAARAPLAVRPGAVAASGHLLGFLRVLHADAADLPHLHERFDPAVGHKTFQWHDDAPGGAARRTATDAAALSHARRRAREVLDDMPTTLAEDLALLDAPLSADDGEHDVEDEDDAAAAAQALLAAVRFRRDVKRLLMRFIDAAGELS